MHEGKNQSGRVYMTDKTQVCNTGDITAQCGHAERMVFHVFEMYLRYFTENENFPFFIQYGVHNTDFFMHTHADYSELAIVLYGNANHIVNNESYFIKKRDVFVINSDTSHGFSNTNNLHICNIMYRPERLFFADIDIRRSSGFHALFVIEPYLAKSNHFKSRLALQLTEFEHVNSMIMSMLHEFEQKKEGFQTMLSAQFIQLIVLLSRLYHFSATCDEPDIVNIARSVSYIENHYRDPISIGDLADQCNFSKRHFSRVFKKAYQTTPCNYILGLRLQHSCVLLKNTSLSISEIASQSGFSDSNYFTRQFRKSFYMTPKEYRLGSNQ